MKKNPVILLHGLFGAPLGLDEIANGLRKVGFEVIVPAVPPFAGAEEAWEARSEMAVTKRYAEYFKEYFAKEGIEKPILVGHSMGTLVVGAILANYPEILAEKVVFLSPVAARPSLLVSKVSVLAADLPQKFSDWVTTHYLAVGNDRKKFRQILRKVHQCSLDQRPKRKHIREAVAFSSKMTVGEELAGLMPDYQGKFEMMVIAGEDDHLIKKKATERMVRELNEGKNFAVECEFLPRTGHLHNYEKPQETVALIVKFLTEK